MNRAEASELVLEFGGCVERGVLFVPPQRLGDFIDVCAQRGTEVTLFECLFHGLAGVRPSMEHSRERKDFIPQAEFVAFARQAADQAANYANEMKLTAVFEVCINDLTET